VLCLLFSVIVASLFAEALTVKAWPIAGLVALVLFFV